MTVEDYKPLFDRDGFVVIRPFLDAHELGELREHLDRYIREIVPSLPDTAAFYLDRTKPESLKQLQHMGRDPFFRDYPQTLKWMRLATTLLGEPVQGMEPEWFNKPPRSGSPTPPHQDNFYFKLTPPNVVTLWLALDEIDDENGCLHYVRGSHYRGVRPHTASNILGFSQTISDYGETDEAEEVAVHLSPGDLVVHHGHTIHRADANRSNARHRRAFAIVYTGASCRRDEDAFADYNATLHQQQAAFGLEV